VVSRADSLRSEHRLDSLLSREAVFLLNNLVLVALCFVVFWGTFFPLISEAVTGRQASVGPPWFDRYMVPLALILVLLSGIGPVIAWRRATPSNLWRNMGRPALCGIAVLVVLVALGVTQSVPALLMFAFAGFVAGVVGQELWRGVRARRAVAREPVPVALVSLVKRNRRRYGGYLVHLGVATLFVGVAASSSFQKVHEVRLSPGQSARVGDYKFTYVKPVAELHAASNGRLERISLGAQLRVQHGGKTQLVRTSKDYFPSQDPSLGPVSREPAQRRVERGGAGHEPARPADRRGRPRVHQERRRAHASARERVPGRRPARPHLLLREGAAAGHVPARGVPARQLDLDRGRARPARRHPGRLAVAAWADEARQRALRRPRRTRSARPRVVELVLIFVVIAVVVLVVTEPLRRRGGDDEDVSAERAELDAAKEAKYREIRDAELDYRTGKLSERDWRALDRTLRAEAVDLLKRLDRLEPLP
jgi:hypothetical protein